MMDTIQGRLLKWVALFLLLFSVILTLSPAVRARGLTFDLRWSHWFGYASWLVVFTILHRSLSADQKEHDQYLLPLAALLTGWGLLTVWRLDSGYGLRQALWLLVSGAAFVYVDRHFRSFNTLRQHKYLLLSGGLLLTFLTLFFGTNPVGIGPRLWLGCCGVYFQPSEPLKLLFVIYLSAYLAEHLPIRMNWFPLFLPTLFVVSLAMLLLIIQRDLGTASLFILIYSAVLFVATGRRRVLLITISALFLALVVGYFFIDLLRVRVEGWINPWVDPSGDSYQIIQSIMAVANGGLVGRGPGLGSPGLVPVALSDFIYSAITEETGLVGGIALVILYLLMLSRGLDIALHAQDGFQRLLAAGITCYLGLQSILILGGNLRILPLTGVTLPFVSYGGSSLLTSFFTLLILLRISREVDRDSILVTETRPFSIFAVFFAAGFTLIALSTGWWAVIRGADVLTRSDNPRRAISDRFVERGAILDRNNQPISITSGQSGDYYRTYLYPELSPLIGYTHPVFGQSGLESSLDDYLRGVQGNPTSLIFWDHLLYGTPPPGLDVRLSLDLNLQSQADQLLSGHTGAVVLIQAQTGELFVIASHPTFDANLLDLQGSDLAQDPGSPLLNRATQGKYPPGSALKPFIESKYHATRPSRSQLLDLYENLNFFAPPNIRAPVDAPEKLEFPEDLLISPLQLALASAAMSNNGSLPGARLALAVNTPNQGWVVLPELDSSIPFISDQTAAAIIDDYTSPHNLYWLHTGQADAQEGVITWCLAGTLVDWSGAPMSVVVLLEEDNILQAEFIATELLNSALQ
jgi:cell division protein FtsW (lipid II flippase)